MYCGTVQLEALSCAVLGEFYLQLKDLVFPDRAFNRSRSLTVFAVPRSGESSGTCIARWFVLQSRTRQSLGFRIGPRL